MAPKETPQSFFTDLPPTRVSFDVEEFDNAIRSHGALFVHFRAMRCPVGLIDPYDQRRPHDDHSGCSNGFIYTTAGKITTLFLGNGMESNLQDAGLLDMASAQATIPRFYDGTEETVYIAPYDRLYLSNENILVVNWQTFQHANTGRDKLSFPVEKVQDLIDNLGRSYRQGVDFECRGGVLVWTGQNRPGLDPETGKGRVCTARYLYRPYWYVKRLVHEIRISQVENPVTSERSLERMPQAIMLQREYVFEKEANDPEAPNPNSLRQVKAPGDGSFGPR